MFDENSTTDSTNIDHLTPEHVITHAGDNEEPDFAKAAEKADKNGTAPIERTNPTPEFKAKSPTPWWVELEFAWYQRADGTWYLRAHDHLVAQCIDGADKILADAHAHLSEEQKMLAKNFANSLKECNADAAQMDDFLGTTASRAFATSAGQSAARAIRNLAKAAEERARFKKEDSGQRSLEFAKEQGLRGAMIRFALVIADPTVDINYKGGVYDSFRMDAAKYEKQFMNPDEAKAQQEAEGQGTDTLIANLFN